MQVMLLIHADEAAWPRMPEAGRQAAMAAYGAYTEALRAVGALVNSNRLMPPGASQPSASWMARRRCWTAPMWRRGNSSAATT
jgi:hypothetical protein